MTEVEIGRVQADAAAAAAAAAAATINAAYRVTLHTRIYSRTTTTSGALSLSLSLSPSAAASLGADSIRVTRVKSAHEGNYQPGPITVEALDLDRHRRRDSVSLGKFAAAAS
jgi:hypothetical protein